MNTSAHQRSWYGRVAVLALAATLAAGGVFLPAAGGAESPPGQLKPAKAPAEDAQAEKKTQKKPQVRGRMAPQAGAKGEEPPSKAKKAKKAAPGGVGATTIRSRDGAE